MATIYLYEKNGLKRGNPILAASFEQVLWNDQKKEYYVPIGDLPRQGDPPNAYQVSLLEGATGTIQVNASNRSARAKISNFGTFEIWV